MLSRESLQILAKIGRIEIIRTLKSYPDRDFTVNELSKTAKLATMTTWRATKELKKIGLVKTRMVGNATIVSMTEDRDKLRMLRLIPETDPQRMAAFDFARRLAGDPWLVECRLFGSIGRGEHLPGDEVDVAVVYDNESIAQNEAEARSRQVADLVKGETNVTIVPLCVPQKDMSRKGGLAAELRDKEIVFRR